LQGRKFAKGGATDQFLFLSATGKLEGIMSGARSFEDLWIWQTARGLVKEVYSDFGMDSPAARDFGFLDQIRRAAQSIMNNIAEGFERGSDADFANFLRIAKGSPRDLAARSGVCSTLPKISVTRRQIWQTNVVKSSNNCPPESKPCEPT
jgi:four helix bundle protein